MQVHDLAWKDVDPSLHPFDSKELCKLLEDQLEKIRPGDETEWRTKEVGKISTLLQNHFGRWAVGWHYSAGEPGGGGPVHSWCCETHSFFVKGYSADDIPAVGETIAASLGEWRNFLNKLRDLFHPIKISHDAQEGQRQLSLAVSQLLSVALQQTNHADAWYNLLWLECVWMLESLGLPRVEAETCAEFLEEGQFESWTRPDEMQSQGAAQSFASKAYEALEHHGLTHL